MGQSFFDWFYSLSDNWKSSDFMKNLSVWWAKFVLGLTSGATNAVNSNVPVTKEPVVREDDQPINAFGNWLNGVTGLSDLNAFNSEEAEKQRAWQEEMMNTQYQRTVADMKAAGINPASLTSGASLNSMSSGASASSVQSQTGTLLSGVFNSFSKILDSILDAVNPMSKVVNIIKK